MVDFESLIRALSVYFAKLGSLSVYKDVLDSIHEGIEFERNNPGVDAAPPHYFGKPQEARAVLKNAWEFGRGFRRTDTEAGLQQLLDSIAVVKHYGSSFNPDEVFLVKITQDGNPGFIPRHSILLAEQERDNGALVLHPMAAQFLDYETAQILSLSAENIYKAVYSKGRIQVEVVNLSDALRWQRSLQS